MNTLDRASCPLSSSLRNHGASAPTFRIASGLLPLSLCSGYTVKLDRLWYGYIGLSWSDIAMDVTLL